MPTRDHCVQNVATQTEAGGFCRDEYQDFMTYFARPLIQKHIGERYALPESRTEKLPGCDQTFCEVVDTMRTKLQGAYECAVPGDTLVRDVPRGHWRVHNKVPLSAYKPTTGAGEWPFFVTVDRSTAHSFWIVYNKVHLDTPGIPLLQLLRVPPRGHDIHQIVEHAIGAMKVHVYKVLGTARAAGLELSTALVRQAIIEGCALFTAASWAANLPRLVNCLTLVAADQGEEVPVTTVSKAGVERTSVQRGTGGGYCQPRCA